MKSIIKILFLTISSILLCSAEVYSQIGIGTDITNRYVWRGADFGNSPSIQPDINYSSGGFEIGTWAAFATNGDPAGSEVDFYASYTFETSSGSIGLSVTDYTFPEDPVNNYFSKESHFVETTASFTGTDTFPISVSTGIFLTNDDDYSIYTELGYSVSNVDLFLGFTPAESALYGTSKAGIINTGFSVTQDVQITELFSVGLSGTVIANPHSDNLFFLIGFGF